MVVIGPHDPGYDDDDWMIWATVAALSWLARNVSHGKSIGAKLSVVARKTVNASLHKLTVIPIPTK